MTASNRLCVPLPLITMSAALVLFTGIADLMAQQLPPNTVAGVATGASTSIDLPQQRGLTAFFSSRTPYEFWLTVLNIAFGLATLSIVLLIFRNSIEKHAEQLIRFAIVVVIVVSTLVLITAGYSNEQVAPAFGLFGTIVGYILGRMSAPNAGGLPVAPDGRLPQPGAEQKP
jgi:hypothetical protein